MSQNSLAVNKRLTAVNLTVLVPALLTSLCLSCGSIQVTGQETPEQFTISGTVLSADGHPVPRSVVIPLSEFGVPLNRDDATPATMESVQTSNGKDFLLFTTANDDGVFSLDLPVGKYRIVAQTWPDQPDVTDLLGKNGSRLRIDGMSEIQFKTEMQAAEDFEIRPLGNASIKLTSQEAGDLLLISTVPLAGDPALGFMALTGGFWGGLIGGTKMTKKEMWISGLPDGEIQFYSFVNDNNGGWGGVKASVYEGEPSSVHLPLIAGWSNGHRTPPPELEDLFDYFVEHPDESERLSMHTNELQKQYMPDDGVRPGNWVELATKMASHLQDEYTLGNGKTVTLADAWAANAYCRMNR